MSIRAKLLLSLALLREFYNRVEHYKSIVRRNIHINSSYKTQLSDESKIKYIEREIADLENIYKQLNSIGIFIEHVIIRLETLVMANSTVVSVAMMRDVVKVLRSSISKSVPVLAILVDRLDELVRSLLGEIQSNFQFKSTANAAILEARRIVEEAKKVAGM